MIFEVKVPDAAGMFANPIDRISSPESIMPCVETQPDQFRVRQAEQFFYFSMGFHKSRAVMVKHTADPRRVSYCPCDMFHGGSKHQPLLVA